jgi:hypothetical protein
MEDSRTDTTPREIIALAMHGGVKSLQDETVFLPAARCVSTPDRKTRPNAHCRTWDDCHKAGVNGLPDRTASQAAALSGCGQGINGPAF